MCQKFEYFKLFMVEKKLAFVYSAGLKLLVSTTSVSINIQNMEMWMERLGMEGFVLIGIGVCGVLAAMKVESRAILNKPVQQKCWKLVEFDELVKMIRHKDIQLFDVRERDEVANTGLIPTANNIPCK